MTSLGIVDRNPAGVAFQRTQRLIITYEIHFALARLKLTGKVDFIWSVIWRHKTASTNVENKILLLLVCFLLKSVAFRDLVYKMAESKARVTYGTAYCDVGTICAHNTATRAEVTSVQWTIQCVVQYVCRKWHVVFWHNFYRWRLWLSLTLGHTE